MQSHNVKTQVLAGSMVHLRVVIGPHAPCVCMSLRFSLFPDASHVSAAHWPLERKAFVKTSIRREVNWLQRLHPQNQRKVCLLLPTLETSRRGVGLVTIAASTGGFKHRSKCVQRLCVRVHTNTHTNAHIYLYFLRQSLKGRLFFQVVQLVGKHSNLHNLHFRATASGDFISKCVCVCVFYSISTV